MVITVITIIMLVKCKMKYIICIPTGGFNDILNIINRCFLYAIKYNRLLIIDTTKFGWFIHDIQNYILFTHYKIYNGNIRTIYEKLKGLTYMPSITSGMLLENRVNRNKFGDICLINDFKEDVVISCCGNGIADWNGKMKIFDFMIFKPKILEVFNDRYSKIPKDYTSFHVRNTDIKTPNIEAFIKSHTHKIVGPCFIASDDINIIQKFMTINKNIFCFSNIPAISGNQKNIHYNNNGINKEQFIIDCIVDILLLASAKTYHFSSNISGYSKLAKVLFDNKSLLNRMINLGSNEKQQNIYKANVLEKSNIHNLVRKKI